MSIHIGAEAGQIAETVLLPGDPYRARWAAEKYLEGAELVTEVRGMLGFTGTYKGNRVTIQGTGMGMPSISIYVNELIKDYGVNRLIRVGSCGGFAEQVKMRDIVIAMTAHTVGSPSSSIFKELNFAPSADFELLTQAKVTADKLGMRSHVGSIFTSDTFYNERHDLTEQMLRHGTLAVEMETAELYMLAARYGKQALSITTCSDHVIREEYLPSLEREQSFGEMVELALATAFPQ